MINEIIQRAGSVGCKEVVDRDATPWSFEPLSTLWVKTQPTFCGEFEGKACKKGSGDVKYHQRFLFKCDDTGGEVHLALAFNPSHLKSLDQLSKVQFGAAPGS